MIERKERKLNENSVFCFFLFLLLYFIDGKYGNLFDKKNNIFFFYFLKIFTRMIFNKKKD